MNRLDYSEIVNINYQFIFDYYDRPLSFIATFGDSNYFFYFIDDNTFFISDLSKRQVENLSDFKNLRIFFQRLIEDECLEIVHFDFGTKKVLYDNFNKAIEKYSQFIPTKDSFIEYDYEREIEISNDFRFEKHLFFPLETNQLNLRLKDIRNSSSYKAMTIINILEPIENAYQILKEKAERVHGFIDQEMMLEPFAKGSFRVKISIGQSNQLFENDLSFKPFLNLVNELSSQGGRELNVDLIQNELDIKLFENVEKVYSELDSEDLNLDFEDGSSGDKTIVTLQKNQIVENNIQVIKDKIKRLKGKTVQTEIFSIDGEILNANVKNNAFGINTQHGYVYGKFSNELLRMLRDKSRMFYKYPASITAELQKDTEYDSEGNLIKEKFTLLDFK